MTDENWQSIRVTPTGWGIQTTPLIFKRFSHQKPMLSPIRGGNCWKLLNYVNITDPDTQKLFMIHTIGCFIPNVPRPIFLCFGGQGSAKTSSLESVRQLIDPSILSQGLSISNSPNEMIQQLDHHHFTHYDNVSFLRGWQSDNICKAVTGAGLSKRRLYSNDEDIIFSFKHLIGLNGINLVARKGDIFERSILYPFPPIAEKDRKTEGEFWQAYYTDLPQILGGVLDVLVETMGLYPLVKLDGLPRMADFAKWGYAIGEALGVGGEEFIRIYTENQQSQYLESIKASVIGWLIYLWSTEHIQQKYIDELIHEGYPQDHSIVYQWEGTFSELLTILTGYAENQNPYISRGRQFPKNEQVLSRRINEVEPALIKHGIKIEKWKSGDRYITVTMTKTVKELDAMGGKNAFLKNNVAYVQEN
jgi:hypothetical protein